MGLAPLLARLWSPSTWAEAFYVRRREGTTTTQTSGTERTSELVVWWRSEWRTVGLFTCSCAIGATGWVA